MSTARGYALGSVSRENARANWDWEERGAGDLNAKVPTESQENIVIPEPVAPAWGIQKQVDVTVHRSEGAVVHHERSVSSFESESKPPPIRMS